MLEMKTWFNINAKAGTDNAEVLLFDEIGLWGITAKDFIDQVKATGAKKLTVRINSPGGSVFDGLAIYNYLASLADVTTIVEGVAASMASVIALAGKTRKIAENSFFMVHSPWSAVAGTADDMRETADLLDKLAASLAGIYAKRTGKTDEEVKAWMETDTWFSGSEALSAGLATEITAPVQAVASLRPSFKNVPAALSANNNPPQKPRMNKLLQSLAAAGLITASDVTDDAAAEQFAANIAKLTKERDDALTAKVTVETALAELQKSNVTALVESAVADGRIEAGAKDEWVAKLVSDEASAKLLSSIKKPTVVGHAPLPAGNHNDPAAQVKTLTEKCMEANKAAGAK